MAVTDWLNFGTFSSDASNGSSDGAWASPSAAATSNDVTANRPSAGAPTLSQYLKALNPQGAPILIGAIMLGIEVRIEKRSTIANDMEVKLVKAGAIVGNNKAQAPAWPNAADAYVTYGGSADLWGITLNAPDIGANFGVVLSATYEGVIEVDHIQIRFYYHPGGMMAIL